jgi:DNA adenine methylase
MTTYHGGKQRIGKRVSTAISEFVKSQNSKVLGYCEPFCGMLGVYRHVITLPIFGEKKFIASDINKSVIKMWKKSVSGWIPPSKVDREYFDTLKYDGKYSAEKGFVGHLFTYRGVFFDGYFNQTDSKIKNNISSVVETSKKMENVIFKDGSYDQHSDLKNFVIYCDPPYYGVNQRFYTGKEYKNRIVFDYEKFWNWCRKMSKNNIVIISEYSAPKDFKEIWSFKKEKLFVLAK